MNLKHPIHYLKGVSSIRATQLYNELGLSKLIDLLYFFPSRYVDRSKFYKINEIIDNNSHVQIIGKVTELATVKQKKGSRLIAKFQDETGILELVWFKGIQWIKDSIKINTQYVIYGRLTYFKGSFSVIHPEMDLVETLKKKQQIALQPLYPTTDKLNNSGLSTRVLRGYIDALLQQTYPYIQESLSVQLIHNLGLIGKKEALLNIHFPSSPRMLQKAQYRLKFEELFFIQLQLIRNKRIRKNKIKGYVFKKVGPIFNEFYRKYLPFELTNAQKIVLKEIRKDVASNAHMNRLLQGDVGSGKTIVALLTMLIAIDNDFQAALMAPTEILAHQHFTAVSKFLKKMNISVDLLTGSVKVKKRKEIYEKLESGSLHILIGTHALLENKVKFANLGIAIIDEQHRFGVAQRSKMWQKNKLPPHILVMSATPIPRTLAMSVYGDLDISSIHELPPGRKEVKTFHRYDRNRLAVFKFMKQEIEKGKQVYVVYPLIQESEVMDYKDLMDGYESISREFPTPKYQMSIVHGKMKAVDKEYEMRRFVKGETQIMVATTVIEVGVNIPNASIMIVESAERFGLSQLHQLRGRVGRGADQSYCILLTSFKLSSEARTRIETMVATSDGFRIAEADLKLRGPGNIMGTQQSGVLNLKIADLVKDSSLLYKARTAAIEILQEDPDLLKPENIHISNTYKEIVESTGLWSNIS